MDGGELSTCRFTTRQQLMVVAYYVPPAVGWLAGIVFAGCHWQWRYPCNVAAADLSLSGLDANILSGDAVCVLLWRPG